MGNDISSSSGVWGGTTAESEFGELSLKMGTLKMRDMKMQEWKKREKEKYEPGY